MMRPEEIEAARRAGPCCRRQTGGIVACVAASIVVALVLVLGGEELNVASRHSIQQQVGGPSSCSSQDATILTT